MLRGSSRRISSHHSSRISSHQRIHLTISLLENASRIYSKEVVRNYSKETRRKEMHPETYSITSRWFVPPKQRQEAEKISVPFYEGRNLT